MSKYRKLTSHLASLDVRRWIAEFQEIEAVLEFPLPRSAYAYPAWWSNQASEGHSQSTSWQSIGWRTAELDLANRRVTFICQEPDPSERQPAGIAPRKNHDGLTISEAKAGLSVYYDVPESSIEIAIRG
jgi:putative restriction endonuclease